MTPWYDNERRKGERRQGLCLLHNDLKETVGELRKAVVGKWAFNLIMSFVAAAFLFIGYGMREMNNEITSIAVSQARMAASLENIILMFKMKTE